MIELALALKELERKRLREKLAGPAGLYEFVKYFWHTVEPSTDFVDGWPIWAICRHLEAVHRGDITRLLINVPPGSSKSLITNVFYPAWAWSAGGKPGLRFVSFSYGSYLTERDNERMLIVLKSPEFLDLYGHAFTLTAEGKVKVSNSKRGWKFASSVGGVGTGERGDVILYDDPHPVQSSQEVIDSTVTWTRETMMNRLNDMKRSAIVCIMQRVNEGDVSDFFLNGGEAFEHLLIPMEFEPDRAVRTSIGWSDPRTRSGECYWPERFPPEAVERCRAQGPFAWASQYQQRPEIRGGGIIRREYWQRWERPQWPQPLEYIVASLDPAFTKLTHNDPSGFTIWGVFADGAILMHAWRKWLEIHGPEVERLPGESIEDHRERSRPLWGLVETVADDCRRFRVNHLLIESKASGHSVAQEMARLYPGGCGVSLIDPKGLDKVARALRVQPEFSNGQVWAPDRVYARLAIDEMAVFPRGRYDDITDAACQGLWWLRSHGYMQRRSERRAEQERLARDYSTPGLVYET